MKYALLALRAALFALLAPAMCLSATLLVAGLLGG